MIQASARAYSNNKSVFDNMMMFSKGTRDEVELVDYENQLRHLEGPRDENLLRDLGVVWFLRGYHEHHHIRLL